MGVLGYLKGSALELLDGTLKVRYCTTLFTMSFPLWSLPKVGNGGGKWQAIAPGNPFDAGSNVGKRVRLTRKTRPGVSSMIIPDPGHPTPRRWKRLRRPSSGVGGEGGRASQSFSSPGGWMRFATGDAWNLLSEETGVSFRLVSPAEGVGALAPDHFNEVHAR